MTLPSGCSQSAPEVPRCRSSRRIPSPANGSYDRVHGRLCWPVEPPNVDGRAAGEPVGPNAEGDTRKSELYRGTNELRGIGNVDVDGARTLDGIAPCASAIARAFDEYRVLLHVWSLWMMGMRSARSRSTPPHFGHSGSRRAGPELLAALKALDFHFCLSLVGWATGRTRTLTTNTDRRKGRGCPPLSVGPE